MAVLLAVQTARIGVFCNSGPDEIFRHLRRLIGRDDEDCGDETDPTMESITPAVSLSSIKRANPYV
uniref:Uncharacterized protein n=1 Tax=Helianthus annuus TaxID=4232 RepID=A0A251TNG6_HELAN